MIVLDTHVLIWWIGQKERLTRIAHKKIDESAKKKQILVSSISIWEIYLLVKRGRLKLTMDVDIWVREIENISIIQFIPVDNQIAAKSVTLPGSLHNDPADRMIIATAQQEGAVLITADKRIQKYPYVKTVW